MLRASVVLRSSFLTAFLLLGSRATLAQPACDDPAGAPVSAIVVSGAEAATDEEVREALGVKPGDLVTPLSLAALESAVLSTGWFDRASVVLSAADGGCVLRVRVEEYGPVKAIRFTGRTALPEETLLAAIETKPGEPANRVRTERDADAITERYQEEGFEAARVEDVEIEDGTLTFTIDEGTIARVDVRGARLTGRRRVRAVLGIEPGDVYSSRALIAGQAALYRTGLFSVVGFGVEPIADDPEGRLVLTVTVTEYRSPYSRTEVFAGQGSGAAGEERGLSAASVEARVRNIGAGHSLRATAELLAPAPDELAGSGFDEFYRVRGRGEVALFRPDEAGGGGLVAAEVERVRGRRRDDLGLLTDVDSPALSAGVETPVLRSERVHGFGGFSATGGWREVSVTAPGGPAAEAADAFSGGFGRGEVGLDLREALGIGVAASFLRVRAGIEVHDGLEPFSFASAGGRILWRVAPGHRVEAAGDGAILSGDVPFWRETPIGGPEGPLGYGRELAFARRHARGRVEYAASIYRDVVGASTGLSAAIWSGADRAAGALDAESAYLELRLGPEFARVRAGAALPLPEADREPWFYAGIVIATPY